MQASAHSTSIQFVCFAAGLCDAHVHVTATTANLAGAMSQPDSYTTIKAAHILERMLYRGFTTVRVCAEVQPASL